MRIVIDQKVEDILANPISNFSDNEIYFKTLTKQLGPANLLKTIKLPEIYSLVSKIPGSCGQIAKEQVVLTRCFIGHDRFTQFLIKQ